MTRVMSTGEISMSVSSVVSAANRVVFDRSGATAVEFGIISVPFFTLFAAIVQTGLLMWASQNLDENLQRVTRTLYTGKFQSADGQSNAAISLDKLKVQLCGPSTAKIATVFSCADVKLDVSIAASFGSGSVPNPVDAQTKDWNTNFGSRYTCPKPGQIVVVTAAVKFPIFFSFMNFGSSSFADGSRLLQSTAVTRTEPYSSGSGC
jgi:pilus assembly protein Flp/PilA